MDFLVDGEPLPFAMGNIYFCEMHIFFSWSPIKRDYIYHSHIWILQQINAATINESTPIFWFFLPCQDKKALSDIWKSWVAVWYHERNAQVRNPRGQQAHNKKQLAGFALTCTCDVYVPLCFFKPVVSLLFPIEHWSTHFSLNWGLCSCCENYPPL
jgi:hypothetical protein